MRRAAWATENTKFYLLKLFSLSLTSHRFSVTQVTLPVEYNGCIHPGNRLYPSLCRCLTAGCFGFDLPDREWRTRRLVPVPIYFLKLHFSLLACEDFFLLSGKWRSFVGHVHLSDVRPLTFLLLDHKMRVLAQILDNRFFLVEWWQKWAGQVNIINDSRSNVGPSKHSDVS